jgi:hypothetical protein
MYELTSTGICFRICAHDPPPLPPSPLIPFPVNTAAQVTYMDGTPMTFRFYGCSEKV